MFARARALCVCVSSDATLVYWAGARGVEDGRCESGDAQVLVEVGAACTGPAKEQSHTALLLLALAFLRSVSVEVQAPREPSSHPEKVY